jgi:nucleotide-binding universal stress UspA family protein
MATKDVVAGTDGSEESLLAVEWAAREAALHGAALRIVSVGEFLPGMHEHHEPASVDTVTDVLRENRDRALDTAARRAEAASPGLLIDTDSLSGPIAQAVTDSGSGAAILVVGSRGLGAFAAMILGSVSRFAATHASCPVVVVRSQSAEAEIAQKVVVGVRDTETSADALGFAFEEAALRRAELVVVHSLHGSAGVLSDAASADPAPLLAEAEESLGAALGRWREKYPDVAARPDVVLEHPAKVLAWYSARADLVIIGRREEGSAGPAIGGTKHPLLNHARGPVAVIPPGG